MDIRKMPLDELELLSYADIAYEIIKEDRKPLTTPLLFKEVCGLLEIGEDTMMELIGDFYTTLTTDKRFTLLDGAKWDLKEFHKIKPIIEDDDDEYEDEEETSEDEEGSEDEDVTESEDDIVEDEVDEYDALDDDMDDLDNLSIVTEEEMEEE